VDSLNQILKAQRNTHQEKVIAFNSTISNLQSQLSSLNLKMDEMTKEQSKNNLYTVQLLQQIDSLNKHGGLNRNSILKDCSGAVGNSTRSYPYRITGSPNGCIGDGCDEIPSDEDLHQAILNLKEDYNSDTIIDISDLADAVYKAGDINYDGRVDIYDLIYPTIIKTSNPIKNPLLIYDNQKTFSLMGKLSMDCSKLILDKPVEIIHVNPETGFEFKERKSAISLSEFPQLIVFRNRKIVVTGSLILESTQAYKDGHLFSIIDVLGEVK
jgi:hypothetical protein